MDDVPSHMRGKSAGRVKNKAPAKVQTTAEQLLREAWDRKETPPSAIPKIQIADHEELLEYQRNERKQYEMRIVRNRSHTPLWIRYARWEEEQQEFARGRSIWERAIDNDYRNPAIWLNYAEMEMRHRFINHARNVLDRAVALLPRADQIWLKYAHMEEMLDKLSLARLVYQRWLKWFPDSTAYFAFIRFELRHGKPENARDVYEQLLIGNRTAHSYIKFAKFEERQQNFARARTLYERASGELSKNQLTSGFFLSFAKFEERRKQPDRARAIYKYAKSTIDKHAREDLDHEYNRFEKQHGNREALDEMLNSSRRAFYETALSADLSDYDTWFDFIQLEESSSPPEQIRQTYERAIACVPPVSSKTVWSRHIYIWISYAVWTELSCNDLNGAIQIYKRCVSAIPDNHTKFSFAKLWILYANAEVRRKDLAAARGILGTGLGVMPYKHSLYQAYIDLESALGEMDRVRKIYETWLTRHPTYTAGFLGLAELEMRLGETKRAKKVLELAGSIQGADTASDIWMRLAGIIAISEQEESAIRSFEDYVERHPSKQVWLSYIEMLKRMQCSSEAIRTVYERSLRKLKDEAINAGQSSTSQRRDAFEIGQEWLRWEEEEEEEEEKEQGKLSARSIAIQRVHDKIPRKVIRRQPTGIGERVPQGEGEIIFPEEAVRTGTVGNKLMEAAKRWKLKKSEESTS